MSDLGHRLKEAMDAAVADAQPPPGLMDWVRRGHRYRFWMRPALAAATLAVIVIVAATVLPGVLSGHRGRTGSSGLGERFLAILNVPGTRFIVLNAKTGAAVASFASPVKSTAFKDVATGNGVTYAVAVGGCGVRLYQFTLNSSGKPGRLTSFATGYVDAALDAMAMSPDGRTFAYFGHPCDDNRSAELVVTNLVTMRSRQWTDPNNRDVGLLSLSGDGRLVEYDYHTPTEVSEIASGPYIPDTLYLLRTSAEPGSLLPRSTFLARGGKFGRGHSLDTAQLTPDGRTIYVVTSYGHQTAFDQISTLRVSTGHVTTLARGLKSAFTYAFDPALTHLIAGYESAGPQHSPEAAMINLRTRQVRLLPRSWPVPLYEFYFW